MGLIMASLLTSLLAVIADQTDQLTLAIHRLKMAMEGLDEKFARSNYWFWQRRRRPSVARALSVMGGWRREIHHLGEWNRVDSSW